MTVTFCIVKAAWVENSPAPKGIMAFDLGMFSPQIYKIPENMLQAELGALEKSHPELCKELAIRTAGCCQRIRSIHFFPTRQALTQIIYAERSESNPSRAYYHRDESYKFLLPVQKVDCVFYLKKTSFQESLQTLKIDDPLVAKTLRYFSQDPLTQGLALILDTGAYIWLKS